MSRLLFAFITGAGGVLLQVWLARVVMRTFRGGAKPSSALVAQRLSQMAAAVVGVPAVEWQVMSPWASSAEEGTVITISVVLGFLLLGLGNAGQLAQGHPSIEPARQPADDAQVAWAGLPLKDRLLVTHLARRGGRHPDAVIAAVAVSWAEDVVTHGRPRRQLRSARRLLAVDSGGRQPSTIG